MRLRPACLAASAALVAVLASAPSALAQSDADRATARSLGQDGQTALDGKDYKTAEDRFRRADKLVHAPTLGLGLARALAGGAKYVEAQETYNRLIREGVFPGAPEAFRKAVDDAKKEVDAVSAKVAGATITVQGPAGSEVSNPRVMLDDVSVNAASLGVRRLVDPGAHVLKVAADGFKPAEMRFNVHEGGSVNEQVTLDKDPNATAATTPTPATTAPTTPGLTGTPGQPRHDRPILAAAGPLLVEQGAPHRRLRRGWRGPPPRGHHRLHRPRRSLEHIEQVPLRAPGHAPASEQSDISSYHTMGALSDVGFVVAGVGAAAGVVLLLTAPKQTTGSGFHVAPAIGLGSLGAVGTF